MEPTENADLLGEEAPVEEVVETAELPAEEGKDVSPVIDTGEAKSLAEALDIGLKEVEDRHTGKKPEEKVEEPKLDAEGKPVVEKTPEQLAAEVEAAKDPAKKLDSAVNDPIPAQVAEKTKERMQTLITAVKEKDVAIAEHQAFVDQIAATGATPPEFNTMMSYLAAVHSDNPDHLRLARDLLQSELEGISLKLGEAAPGIDFLAKYPDLKAQVASGEIRREAATEIAMNRTKAANAKTVKDQADERQRAADTTTAERTAAQTELTTLGDQLYARDKDEYVRRYAILEPSLQALGMLPPGQWKAAFMRAYNAVQPLPASIPKPAAGAAPVTNGAARGQPLRANKTPSGDAPKQGPKTLFEAIDGALKGMQ